MANNYKNAKLDLTSTDATVLYTAPAAHTGIFKSILVCDDSNNGDTLTLTLTDASSNEFVIFDVKTVSGHQTIELITQPLVVMENEILKVTAGTIDRLHVVASYLEIT